VIHISIKVLEIGQEVTAEVIGTLKGMPVISLRNAQLCIAWEEIMKVRFNTSKRHGTIVMNTFILLGACC